MKYFNICLRIMCFLLLFKGSLLAQPTQLADEAREAMLRSTRYMVEQVSTNGGYVWYYLPDLSRRWGEMEAYKTMVWVQGPGTVNMGHVLLDAYRATGNDYYYQAAGKAAAALVWGQSKEGGWNYMIDFAGDRSLKYWYSTIGKNGWRLEEFQHYYGNATFDDDVTSNAARFLLRMYLEKMDPKYKPALDKAIDFILESQYPLGGWPQRYPLRHDFSKNGNPDYSSFYTYNDDVIWENINFLVQCYLTLGEERLLEPIYRGMNFFVISQHGSGAWGQQYNMALEPAGARTYEPPTLLPTTTFGNAMLLLRFYQYTGDRKYLSRIPDAIAWLEKTRLPKKQTENGTYTHPTFVEIATDKPVYVHRTGSNVKHGYYFYDYNDENLLAHYKGKKSLDLERLKAEYKRVSALSPAEATKDSPLKAAPFQAAGTPQSYYNLHQSSESEAADAASVKTVIASLDAQNRWLVKHAMISNPYRGEGQQQEQTNKYASAFVGDETDTSPFRDPSDQEYISTGEYIRNMQLLISYLKATGQQATVTEALKAKF
ncbi:pectate lyase [Botryobacter ruber]|uniref:pectate lyase n=1 Tax=Botryobacter ruber TaxID=2171629 RepID=UPI000E0B7A5A|nr:pectate lyase [Botryobacter ruber]